MKNIKLQGLVYLCLLLVAFSSCTENAEVDPNALSNYTDAYDAWTADPRGEINEQDLILSWTAEQVDSILNSFGDPTIAILTPIYGVDLYKINHKTVDARGEEIVNASGLAVIPRDVPGKIGFAAYQHGTTVRKSGVPSQLSDEHMLGIILSAQAGLAVSMTDYLGLGEGEGLHPYVHAKSGATAGIDMLRATKTLCADLELDLNEKLFIFGYSQGGHAAMAMHKEIEEFHTDEFTVTASAPMAGPYDVSGYQAETFLRDQPYDAPYYLPYIILAYNDIYRLYDSPSDFFQSPYDQTIPPLFDGNSGGGAINNEMPAIPNQIFKPELLEEFKFNYNHPFRKALADNDLYEWTPKAPVLLCHCEGDNLVLYENALVAYNSFQERGVDVELVNKGNFDHGGCVFPCMLEGILWFDQYLAE